MRRRLMTLLGAGVVLLLAGAGFGTETLLRGKLTEQFDDALLAKARALVALTEQEGGRIELDYTPSEMPEFERKKDPDYFQYWLDDGRLLLRSKRLDGDLPRDANPAPGLSVRDGPLPDGRHGRLVQIHFTPRAPGPPEEGDETEEHAPSTPRSVLLVMGRGRDGLDSLLRSVRTGVWLVGGIAAALALLLVWRALAVGLRPLDRVAVEVAALSAESLGRRVGSERIPRELAPVVTQLNALLDRLEASFERERRFTANAAHELRTPISELRSLADVGAKWPEERDAVIAFFGDVEGIAGRMERLIADLLLLARCDARVEPIEKQPVDLRELVSQAWAGHAARAGERGNTLRVEMTGNFVIESDEGKLSLILSNLLGNAVSYSPEGSEIVVRGVREVESRRIEVSNRADPLGEEGLRNLTDPFWRKDESRSSEEHAGLGLSVAKALSGLLGARLEFAQDAEGIFVAKLTFLR